jgi:hypothetical protein
VLFLSCRALAWLTQYFKPSTSYPTYNERKTAMKSLILWICGVPISVIILLKIFGVF